MPTIIISLSHGKAPERGQERQPTVEKIPLEAKIKDMIDLVESGHDSAVEWITLNKIFRHLEGRSDKRSKNLIDKIKPVLAKYGQHGVAIR